MKKSKFSCFAANSPSPQPGEQSDQPKANEQEDASSNESPPFILYNSNNHSNYYHFNYGTRRLSEIIQHIYHSQCCTDDQTKAEVHQPPTQQHGYMNQLCDEIKPYEERITPPPSPAPPETSKEKKKKSIFDLTSCLPIDQNRRSRRSETRNVSFDNGRIIRKASYGLGGFSQMVPNDFDYDPEIEFPHLGQESPNKDQNPQESTMAQSASKVNDEAVEEIPNPEKPDPKEEKLIAEIFHYRADRYREMMFSKHRRIKNRSALTFLELSPDSDSDFPTLEDVEFHQLRQDKFCQPVEESCLERPPSPVPKPEKHERQVNKKVKKPNKKRLPPPATSERQAAFFYKKRSYYSYEFKYMGKMNSLEEHERKIIIEFCHLLEKSKQLFNGLRELPQYGHKQWHSYFGRTFDVYTKLWKFQQQHRAILDTKYGLKRWQIGEIASKIGQLYYHFYLRTSETAYLNEAYSFYSAIRGRSYYTQANKEDKCELMVKKLRYYARFIVVCLLLKKAKLVGDLTKELEKQIDEYGKAYEPDDQVEWTVVVEEVRGFTCVEPAVEILHPDNTPVFMSNRLSLQSTPPVDRTPQMNLSLQEVLVIGSNSTQVKFSELTMDMFRIMQTLEREPTGGLPQMYDESPRQPRYISTPSAVNNKGYTLECGLSRGDNPHKYLLFKPSPSQIFVFLASGINELPPNGVIMIYISADGIAAPPGKQVGVVEGYNAGGLITTSKTDIGYKEAKPITNKHIEQQVLYPGDLYAFTRRPMFLIIESDNSYIFKDMPHNFGQPVVVLMSPLEQPASIEAAETDKRAHGSLFTLFLHCPLTAICFICDLKQITLAQWERAQSYINAFMAEASQLLVRNRNTDLMYITFFGDDFLRLLILRYLFCDTALRMHRAFRARSYLPQSSPSLPEDLSDHPTLTHIIMELANYLQVRGHFQDPSGGAAGPPIKE